MNILVIGCGKVGSRLASSLAKEGHEVSVVDRHEVSFEMLDPNDNIYTTTGVPIDQDVLRSAGIENCDAVAAVSQDDNVNIMVSQVAREIFHVSKVVARVYDPKREDVFSHFGLQTICPTNLTVESVRCSLLEDHKARIVNLGPHSVSMVTVKVPVNLVGEYAHNLDFDDDQSLYAVIHNGLHMELFKGQKIILQDSDNLVISQIVD